MTDRSYLTASDLAMDRNSIERSFASHIEYTLAKDEYSATQRDFYRAIALSVRDRLADRWNKTQQHTFRNAERRVYYLSLEYLIGRVFDDAMLSLGITGRRAPRSRTSASTSLSSPSYEDDAGLGNGGLGRLAACFLDSMATLGIPAVGYGIRYEYGIFRQAIVNGEQVEQPDNWLRYPNPWELARPERLFTVHFGGRVAVKEEAGREVFTWVDTKTSWPWRTTRRSPGTETTSSTRSGSGRRAPRATSTSRRSTGATTSRRSTSRARARTSRASFIPTIRSPRGASFGSVRSSSSSPPRCRTRSVATCRATPREEPPRGGGLPAERHAPGRGGGRD